MSSLSNTYIHMDMSNEFLKRYIMKRRWDQVKKMVTRAPHLASDLITVKYSGGETNTCLPLHLACTRKPPIEIVLQLLALNVSAVKEKDRLGRLPLHNACRYNATQEICRIFIAVYPDGASIRALDGTLPLHLTCLYAKDTNNVDALIDAYPGAVDRWDDMGLTPLDYASDNPDSIKMDILMSLTKIKMKNTYESISFMKSLDMAQEELSESEDEIHNGMEGFKRCTTQHVPGDFSPTDERDDTIQKSATKSCVVCMDKDVSCVLLPCGHPCLCEECSTDDSMYQMGWRCPECRAPVREVAKVFGRVVAD